MSCLFGGRNCVDPATQYAECVAARLPTDTWAGRANAFALTAGREPGRGFVLLRHADLLALDATSDHELTFLGRDTGHAVTFSPITLLRYECISPGSPDDAAAVYLCELVDRRHHLRRMFFADGYRAYNVTLADGTGHQTATLNTGAPWTWAEVLADLSGLLDIGTVTVPFTPNGNPANLIFTGSIWDALNDVLARLACVLCYDPTDDTFSTVRLGTDPDDPLAALEDSADYLGHLWDGYSGEHARAWRPEKVQVRFMRRPQPTDGASPYYTIDVTLAAADGVEPDTYVRLEDGEPALGATGTPSNASALATRASERAADWLRQRAGVGRPFVRAWRDIQPLAIAAVGQSVGRVVFDDTGAADGIRTWAHAVTARDLEGWRPLADYPPWWPLAERVSPWKVSVRSATTTALPACTYANGSGGVGATLTGDANGMLPNQDGGGIVAGYTLLVKDQANGVQNGIYLCTQTGDSGTPFILTRRDDADTGAKLLGAVVIVRDGVTLRDSEWVCTTDEVFEVGASIVGWKRLDTPPSQWKSPAVRVATVADIPSYVVLLSNTRLEGLVNGAFPSQDGVSLAVGEDILVKNPQGIYSGVYKVTSLGGGSSKWLLDRRVDQPGSPISGDAVSVREGTVNGGTTWRYDYPNWTRVGNVISDTSSPVAGQLAYFNDTTGKVIENATEWRTNGVDLFTNVAINYPAPTYPTLSVSNGRIPDLNGYTAFWSYQGINVVPLAGVTDRATKVLPAGLIFGYTSAGVDIDNGTLGSIVGADDNNYSFFTYPGIAVYLPGYPKVDPLDPDDDGRRGMFTVMDGVYAIGSRDGFGSAQLGQTGTIKPGATFVGGICTGIGSGSFLADPSNGEAPGDYGTP